MSHSKMRANPIKLVSLYIAIHVSLLLAIGFGPLVGVLKTGHKPFDRQSCIEDIRKNDTIPIADHFTIPFLVCLSICGNSVQVTSDWPDRIFSWVWPVIVLVWSMAASSFGIEALFLITVQVLGDAVYSLYSLLLKIRTWSQCGKAAKELAVIPLQQELVDEIKGHIRERFLAIILLAIVDYLVVVSAEMGGKDPDIEMTSAMHVKGNITNLLQAEPAHIVAKECLKYYLSYDLSREEAKQRPKKLHDVAKSLRRNRTYSMPSAWFVCFLAVLSLLVVVSGLGGSGSSGGKIAAGFTLSWLLPMTLLSNRVGDWLSYEDLREHLYKLLQTIPSTNAVAPTRTSSRLPLAQSSNESRKVESTISLESFESIRSLVSDPNLRLENLMWHGGIPVYQPVQPSKAEKDLCENPWFLLFMATIPVMISCATAVGALSTRPIYFNDRGFLIFGFALLLVISTILTFLLTRFPRNMSMKWRGRIICQKNAFLASVIVGLLFASTTGILNSCRTWSNVYYERDPMKRVTTLDAPDAFHKNTHAIYPGIYASCIVPHLLYYCGIRWIVGRRGLGALIWSDREDEKNLCRGIRCEDVQQS